MELLTLVFLSFCYVSFGPIIGQAATHDVTAFGAKGDGRTYDTDAFNKAWQALCGDTSANPKLIIPGGKAFLLHPVAFTGPCKSPKVYVQLLGNITAPKTLDGWKNCTSKTVWIYFGSVNGLTIEGNGRIDGYGSLWWRKTNSTSGCLRPWALLLNNCNGLRIKGTYHINSPMLHISINNCKDVDISNIHIQAPADSPNTDGIDLGTSSKVHIHDSVIQTGDDCVAINGGCTDINITGVACGPGHGISIGSLGEHGNNDSVEQVRVVNCNLTGTTNGVRIKTVPGGTGHAKQIYFEHIRLINVGNPIIIDQHYCSYSELHDCPSPPSKPAVLVSSVTFQHISGTSSTKLGINLNCSDRADCTNIIMDQVSITGQGVEAYCRNVQGRFTTTAPAVKCI